MSEHKMVAQLRSVSDRPVDPPRSGADDLWRRIESELDSETSFSLTTDTIPDEETSVDTLLVSLTVKRALRNPVWAAVAAFGLVLGFGLVVWWLVPPGTSDVADPDQSNEAFSVPGPVQLAAGDVLWPAGDMTGTPSSTAEAFAVEVLGWSQAAASATERDTCLTYPNRNTESCPTDATTVTLVQDGVDPLELVVHTIGQSDTGQLWAVAQVGSGYTTDRLESVDTGTRIPLPQAEEVVEADITMKLANIDNLIEVNADIADLEAGYVDTELVADPDEVLSVLIRYRDADGHVITAAGGPWNEFYEWAEPEPAGPEVSIAEGTYQGSTRAWRMSAFQTTEGNLCIRLEGMGCIGDIPPGEHLGALLTDTGFDDGEENRWCAYGTVRDTDTVRLHLPDGTQTTAPIFTAPEFDVDFYAYCSLGNQPANQVTALDADGNIIDVVPETNNS
ncbi:MAG: hypothetical protein ACFCU2_13480 [Acidimicrobiia bacterium]